MPAGAQHYLARPQTIGGNPGPAHNYVCPNVESGTALNCYFDAVLHLYTMCRHVKSIEIIEHGYEKSDEGTNTARASLASTSRSPTSRARSRPRCESSRPAERRRRR